MSFGFYWMYIRTAFDNLTTAYLGYKFRCSFSGNALQLWINTSLKAIGGIGLKKLFFSGYSDGLRIKPSTLYKHIGGLPIDFRIYPAHNAGHSHWLFSVANKERAGRTISFNMIEGFEDNLIIKLFHNNLIAFYGVGVESMQRLAQLEHHIICDINDVIYRPNSNCLQAVLKPAW